MPVDYQQVERGFAARSVRSECPMCGHGAAAIDPNDYVVHAHIAGPPAGIEAFAVGIEAIAVVCENCGFVRMHARNALGV